MSPDLASSIKAQLLNQAKARGEEFERTLMRFAAERFLFRLGASAARNRCILKGASLLAVWLPSPYRVTRDIDVLGSGPTDDAAIRSLLEEICAVPCPEDAIRFDLADLLLEPIRAREEYVGKRARFRAHLGSARIVVQLDIGVGDAMAVQPQEIEHPTMLKTMPAPRLRGYPRETSMAEKFEAMVKLATQNSRMKDFHDVWALSGAFAFDGPTLQRAITACFERRGVARIDELPPALTPAFYRDPALETKWKHYLAAGAVLVPPPTRFDQVGERIISFLNPVRVSIVEGVPFPSTWGPGGPWQ